MIAEEPCQCIIDDFGPLPVSTPLSIAELTDLIQHASAHGQAIYPLGGRTMLDYGLPPTRRGIGIDLRRLTQVIDYPARDMTVTVQAGITLSNLQELLATENQRLPVDVPHPDRATLGGALATNASGPRRYGFGTLRDYVIGITVQNDEGKETKAGGRVVKNVAGYDLCKLHIGALGTLGIISQVTLKLKPRPEQTALVELACPAEKLAPLLDLLHASRTRPASLSVLNNQAAGALLENGAVCSTPAKDDWLILVGFEDNLAAVDWQVRQVQSEVRSLNVPCVGQWLDRAAEPIWKALADFPVSAKSKFTFKVNLLPRDTAGFCQKAADWPGSKGLLAHAGNGIVIGHAREDLTLEQAQRMLTRLQEQATASQGNVVVLRCPPAWKTTLPIWGTARSDLWLMRDIKGKFDPGGLFNPGRFVDGM